jgi:hypothetical protein
MKASKTRAVVSVEHVDRHIRIIRVQRVMLDADLAKLYGIPTMALNQAVRRNCERFLDDVAFQLTQQEFTALISQTVISNVGRGGRRKLPWAFTEQGVAMLSSVLRSPTAVKVNIEIMRAFVRLRRLLATPGELVAQLQQLAETVQLHDEQIKAIADVLRKMMEPRPAAPRKPIGFQPPEASADGQARLNHFSRVPVKSRLPAR